MLALNLCQGELFGAEFCRFSSFSLGAQVTRLLLSQVLRKHIWHHVTSRRVECFWCPVDLACSSAQFVCRFLRQETSLSVTAQMCAHLSSHRKGCLVLEQERMEQRSCLNWLIWMEMGSSHRRSLLSWAWIRQKLMQRKSSRSMTSKALKVSSSKSFRRRSILPWNLCLFLNTRNISYGQWTTWTLGTRRLGMVDAFACQLLCCVFFKDIRHKAEVRKHDALPLFNCNLWEDVENKSAPKDGL